MPNHDIQTLYQALRETIEASDHPAELIDQCRSLLHILSPQQHQPIDAVRWVPLEQVSPNDYNPNSVARIEMGLLYTSIKHDGYTQPVVTIWDQDKEKYIIIDGFHRYYVMKTCPDIYEMCHGLLPIVVLEKDINDRMASTVRHNRARGKHSIQGMSNLVLSMFENGWSDAEICAELGMSAEEILRLKHITGFSKLFADVEYQKAWVTTNQVRIAQAYKKHQQEVQQQADSPTKPRKRQQSS